MHLTTLRQRIPQPLHLGPQRCHFRHSPIRGRSAIPAPAPAPVARHYPLPMTRPIPVVAVPGVAGVLVPARWAARVSCPQRRRWQSAGETVRGAALPQCATCRVRVNEEVRRCAWSASVRWGLAADGWVCKAACVMRSIPRLVGLVERLACPGSNPLSLAALSASAAALLGLLLRARAEGLRCFRCRAFIFGSGVPAAVLPAASISVLKDCVSR